MKFCHPERSEDPLRPSGPAPREAGEGWGGGLAALGMTVSSSSTRPVTDRRSPSRAQDLAVGRIDVGGGRRSDELGADLLAGLDRHRPEIVARHRPAAIHEGALCLGAK